MHRTADRRRFAATAILLFAAACSDSAPVELAETDLLGNWESTTISGRLLLTFAESTGLKSYVLRAADGDLAGIDLQVGSDILSQGYWSMTRNILTLADEDGDPLSCTVPEFFDMLMNDQKNALTMDYRAGVEQRCLTRSQLLQESAWRLIADRE